MRTAPSGHVFLRMVRVGLKSLVLSAMSNRIVLPGTLRINCMSPCTNPGS